MSASIQEAAVVENETLCRGRLKTLILLQCFCYTINRGTKVKRRSSANRKAAYLCMTRPTQPRINELEFRSDLEI